MLLLNPFNNIYLIKTLYGILMILPQGKAFGALNKRIKNIEMLILMESKKQQFIPTSFTVTHSKIGEDCSNKERLGLKKYLMEFETNNEIKGSEISY
jgi:hypothetical protein